MRNPFLSAISVLAIAASALSSQVKTAPPTGAGTGGRGVIIDTSYSTGNSIVRIRRGLDTSSVITVSANRARIGVGISLTAGANDAVGAEVESVTPKGPADKAGIHVGDIIMKVNDVSIGSSTSTGTTGGLSNVGTKLITTISALKPEVPATLQVRRGNETLSIKVTPEKDDSQVITTVISPRGADDMAVKRFVEMRGDSAFRMQTLDPEYVRKLPETRISTLLGRQDSAIRWMGRQDSVMRWILPLDASSNVLSAELASRDGSIMLKTSFDALSRLELAPINPELGSYFGATEGVLVLSIAPPGVMISSTGPARAKIAARSGANAGAMTANPPKTAPAAPTQKTPPTDAAKVAPAADTELLNLKPGDVITAVDGRKVATPADLMRILRSYQHDEALKITVLRQRKSTTISTKMPPL